jgi:DNA-binding response OmpR family regulator
MKIPKRILIADDDEDLTEALAIRCRQAGLIVETVADGMSALQQINLFRPDLLILDVNMPYGNGLGVCEMIARDDQLASIPVIVLTGRKDRETRQRVQMLHAQYVAKCPDVWPHLEAIISQQLGLKIGQYPTDQQTGERKSIHGGKENPRLSKLHAGKRHRLDPPGRPEELPVAKPQIDQVQTSDRCADEVFAVLGGRLDAAEVHAARAHAIDETSQQRILCIDDDSDLLNSLTLRLEQYGIEVIQASGGTEGYLNAFFSEVHAIILDYEMPNGNGQYVLRRLKENPLTSHVPVIVLSGRKDRALERTLTNMGAVRYFTKPVDWDKLIGELRLHVRLTAEPLHESS